VLQTISHYHVISIKINYNENKSLKYHVVKSVQKWKEYDNVILFQLCVITL